MDRSFTAKGALLEGVRLIGRRPVLMVIWLVLFLLMAVTGAVVAEWQTQMLYAGIRAGKPVAALNGTAQALVVVEAVISVLASSLIWTSGYRALLRPDEKKPLGFGKAELMVLGARLITQIVSALPLLLLPLLIALNRNLGFWFSYSGPVALLIGLAGGVWSAVAGIWAFDQGRIAPLKCWSAVRPAVARFILLFLGVGIAFTLLGGQASRLAILLNGHIALPSRPSLENFSSVPVLVQTILSATIVTAQIALLAGVTAHAYRTGAPEKTELAKVDADA